MTKPRKQHYRKTPGRCQACGSRLVTGDWHRPGSGGSIQCAHCRPKFVPNPEPEDVSQMVRIGPDPRDPDTSRDGIFQTHNCVGCDSGRLPCKQGHPHNCDNLMARND
jgi:hypothetical protein